MRIVSYCLVLALFPHLCTAFIPAGVLSLRNNRPRAVCTPRMNSGGGRDPQQLDKVEIIDVPAISTAISSDADNVEILKVQLQQSVSEERYAEAADLQRRIRAVEQTVGSSPATRDGLDQLKSRLADAVSKEMYAEAAELKEQINALSVKSPGSGERRADLEASMKEAADNGEYALAAQIQEELKELEAEARYQLTETRGPMQTYKLRKPAKPTAMVLEAEERLRENEEPDYLFYQEPRMTLYVDMPFARRLQELYSKRILQGSAVLDLGAACATYLPEDVKLREVCGLGMNMQEMEANEELTSRLVHDLNEDPVLPYMDEQFDAVLCSNSLPYLTEPERVLEEAARVLRPGGVLIISFTDRCISSKVTTAWSSRGNLDRATLVQDLVRACPSFTEPELIWEVNPMSSAGVMIPGLRGATGGDPFMSVVAYRDAPPPGWALQVVGEASGALGTVQAGPFKGITPFAAMYMLYLLINHAH